MQILALEVEEGFFDGLNLAFSPGLNVVIGPRGSGKTSVIELIRFCFGVEPYTRQAAIDAREHALSVLGTSGRATVIADVDGERLRVSRAADDDEPRIFIQDRPIVLSQREIESVGVDAAGRLKIIDGFRTVEAEPTNVLIAELASLTVRLQDLASELATVRGQAVGLSSVPTELETAETAEQELSQSVAAARKERDRLTKIGDELAALSVRRAVFERAEAAIGKWQGEIESVSRKVPRLEQWPEAAQSVDPLTGVRRRVAEASASLRATLVELTASQDELTHLQEADRQRESDLADEARGLRKQVESVQAGVGDASRRVAQLRERAGQLSALLALEKQRTQEIAELQADRTKILDELDTLNDRRFAERSAIAERLRSELGPRIDIRLTQGAETSEYAAAITSALRGSGLHYKDLASKLAERLSPRELLESIEQADAGLISSIGKISTERATRLVDHIRSAGSGEIVTALIEDTADFLLLDGKEYKPTEILSTGQRCTVVLPLLLAHDDRMLAVDEPEAHLDNAFIVSTVIQALKARSGAQTICATHNANIPVLGEAARVIVLGSDGDRGFVRCADHLDDEPIVEAISSVMEGGRDAFRLRAEFYGANPA